MTVVHLCIPTVRKFDLLDKCVLSAITGTRRPDVVHIVDNSGGLIEAGDYLGFDELESFDVRIYNPGRNLGVAKSWNLFMELVPIEDTVVICNDDVEFGPDALETFLRGIEARPECSLYYGFTGKSHFSLFSVKTLAWMHIGGFDERFFPAYFEDNDFAYRAKLLGHISAEIPVDARHVESATIKSYNAEETEQHRLSFIANERYYIQKWGGLPGAETYTKEFGV